MATRYLKWAKTADVAFRADYLVKTGEKIQNTPLESDDDLYYMVGSDRVIAEHITELEIDYPNDLETNVDAPPINWVPKTS